jgi:hypothetical protein
VVLTEDHCYPEPGWAEALVAAYDDRTAVVGPVVAHANEGGVVAWADYLLGYGPWLDPTPGGDVAYLPGHNSSYRREALLDYEPELERWLEAESVLHWDLRDKGWRLVLEPGQAAAAITQAAPGVRVVIDGGELSESAPGKPDRAKAPRGGEFFWQDAGETRAVRNVGTARIELIEIELK